MENLLIASSRRVRQELRHFDNHPPLPASQIGNNCNVPPVDRKADDVSKRLKDVDIKFSVELGECWMDFVDEYRQVAAHYGL